MLTPTGPLPVCEVTLRCPRHRRRVFSPPPLTPYRSPSTFELMTEVGRLHFLEHRQFGEIETLLAARGVRVPRRTLQHLADGFALRVVAVHLESWPLLARRLHEQGGYVLLLDTTGIPGRLTLQLIDGWSGLALLSASVAQESREDVSRILRVLDGALGPPVVAVRDMSDGLDQALRAVWPGLYILTCHFHYLKAAGLRLFEVSYARLRSAIDRIGVKRRLRALAKRLRREGGKSQEATQTRAWAEAILASGKEAKGRPYPFSLSAVAFWRRCEEVRADLKARLHRAGRRATGAPYRQLEEVLDRLLAPSPRQHGLAREVRRLEARWTWFERLRKALKFRNGPVPLATTGHLSERSLEHGRRRLDWLLGKLRAEEEQKGGGHDERELRRALGRLREDLERRRGELLAPNVKVRGRVRPVPRTTALAEGEFRKLRRHGRRVKGVAEVEGPVQREGPGLLLLENLRDPAYIRLVYGSASRLAERLGRVGPVALQQAKLLTGLSG